MEPNDQDFRPQNKQPDIFAPTPVATPQQTTPNQPVQPPSQPQEQSPYNPSPAGDDRTKKLLFAVAGLIGIFVIIVVIVFATKGNDSSTEQGSGSGGTSNSFYVQEPNAVDVENISNSISDDISGLETDTDFPKDNLTDENLNL